MAHLAIALLGPIQIAVNGIEITDFSYAKVRALLIYLAVEQQAHEREALAELLWPDQLPQVGRNSLRQALATLRQVIGDQAAQTPLLQVTRNTVQFAPGGDYTLDSAMFQELLAASTRHAHTDPGACTECIERWEQAVALYRGPFASGALPRDSQGFEEWVTLQRESYEQQVLEILARLAAYYEQRGQYEQALTHARRQISLDPWREPVYRQMMRLLAAQGQRSAALAVYEQCRKVLQSELGVEPEAETSTLYEQIKQDTLPKQPVERETAPASPPQQPSPALSSIALTPQSLPAPANSFIGRHRELRELTQLLDNPGCRLVTLLGPGGVGKTRLALRLAESIAAQYRQGTGWVELASLTTSEQISEAIARALGLTLEDAGDRTAQLCRLLQPYELLLVLDNMEHLLDGTSLVVELLRRVPRLKLIVTSRERLQLQSEWIYEVGGLPYPGAGALSEGSGYDSVHLLLERARHVQGAKPPSAEEEQAVVRITRTLEGHPLALELAAAAGRSRSFVAIAAAIEHDLSMLRVSFRDLPERHRSVRATLDYSWRMLSAGEQQAMAGLGVFRGGFVADAAQQVAGADEELLEGLVDKSMLRRNGEHYDLHELVRLFALEQLEARGLTHTARMAHLNYAVGLAEQAEPHLTSAGQEEWIERLEADHTNLRAALGWAIEHQYAEQAQRLGAALTRFWWMRGHIREGREWLEQSLKLGAPIPETADQQALAARARALQSAGGMAMQQNDFTVARALLEQALTMERLVGRKPELVRTLNNLAVVLINMHDYQPAEGLIAECMELDRELGDTRGIAYDLGNLGQLAYFRGDIERAVELYTESMELHKQAGDQHSVAVMHYNLAGALRFVGEYEQARTTFEAGLQIFRDTGASFGIALSLHQLAWVHLLLGDLPRARALIREGLPLIVALDNSAELSMAVSLLAELLFAIGDHWRSACLWSISERVLTLTKGELQPPDQLDHERRLAAARPLVDPQLWQHAWEQGAAMSYEAALAYTLECSNRLEV